MIASDFLRLRTRVYGLAAVCRVEAVYGVEAAYGVAVVYGMGAAYGMAAGAPSRSVRRSVRDSVNPEEVGMATPQSKTCEQKYLQAR